MGAAHGAGVSTSEALVPPKPNELDSTARIDRSLGSSGTKSMSHSGEGFYRLRVGGATPAFMAMTENIASTLPAAPNRWPIADFVDDIESS